MIAHATRAPLPYEPDVFLVVDPVDFVDSDSLVEAQEVLAGGGDVVLIQDPSNVSAASLAFVQHFVPDPGLVDLGGLPMVPNIGSWCDHLTEVAVDLPLRGKSLTYPSAPALRCPGHALISGTSGVDACDLICEYESGNGHFLLVLTGAWFHQSALGTFHVEPVDDQWLHFDMQMELVDLLVSRNR